MQTSASGTLNFIHRLATIGLPISFRNVLTCGILAINMASCIAGDNPLFSEIRGNEVFSGSTNSLKAGDGNSTVRRIVASEELARLLRDVGFEVKVVNDRAVTTTKELDPWSFPVLLLISQDEQNVFVVMGLSVVKDESKLPAATLLKLLERNQDQTTARFTYSAERKRTELLTLLSNQALNGTILRDEITRMAIHARNSEQVWNIATATTPEPEPELTQKPEDEVVVQPSTNLTGRWSASRSTTEAFAAEFKADGTFVLVHLKAGNQTRSAGTFLLDQQTLTLTGSDGLKLVGTWKSLSATEFEFAPNSTSNAASALRFRKQ